jgi:microcystin-dependent protein
MSLLRSIGSLFSRPTPEPADGRRQFFRQAAGLGAGMAMGSALLLPDEAWAGVEERAARFGITPGTLVDAQGRPMQPSGMVIDPFIGFIGMFGFNFPPRGWALCNGQLLSIAQYTALFSLLGTNYGGNGQTTFALPNLQGRMPMHFGQGPGLSPRSIGEVSGQENVTLLSTEMPTHTHALGAATTPGTTDAPAGAVPARPASSIPQYAAAADGVMAPTQAAGGNQPHNNMPPYLALNFSIALEGIYPSRN